MQLFCQNMFRTSPTESKVSFFDHTIYGFIASTSFLEQISRGKVPWCGKKPPTITADMLLKSDSRLIHKM